VKEVIEYI